MSTDTDEEIKRAGTEALSHLMGMRDMEINVDQSVAARVLNRQHTGGEIGQQIVLASVPLRYAWRLRIAAELDVLLAATDPVRTIERKVEAWKRKHTCRWPRSRPTR